MMEFVNGVLKWAGPPPAAALEPFLLLLAPYAPHLAEEMWQVRLPLHLAAQRRPYRCMRLSFSQKLRCPICQSGRSCAGLLRVAILEFVMVQYIAGGWDMLSSCVARSTEGC